MFQKYLLFLIFPISIFSQNIEVCGENGFYTFTENELKEPVKEDLENLTKDVWTLYLSGLEKGIQKVTDLTTNPRLETICSELDGEYSLFYELATNSKGEIFLSTDLDDEIKKVNLENCTTTTIPINFSYPIHAMSFDTADNLYISRGGYIPGYDSQYYSVILRADANDLSHFYEWHDFGTGHAAGDMVMIDGKMYIAWVHPSLGNRLYEVEVDNDFQYVSHRDLGRIRNETYGLAGEFGKLYGVTKRVIYEINLPDLSTKDIFEDPFPVLQYHLNQVWFGATGKHEAVILDYSFHENETDAQMGNLPINFPYTNQIANRQTVYLRIFGKNSDETIKVVPINLIIKNTPTIDLGEGYKICKGNEININLDTELSSDDFDFQWFLNGIAIGENSPKITAKELGTYSVKALSKTDECDTYGETKISESYIDIISVQSSGAFLEIIANGTDLPFFYDFGNSWQSSPRTSNFGFGKVAVSAKNSFGCIANHELFLPPTNVITPNNDGKNDFFSFEFSENGIVGTISIFDRFGNVILQSETDNNFRWNGKQNGRNVATGTYWYQVSINGNLKHSGFILVKNR
ncbi:MAG: T9SS type B sorting domain-containing protein [Cruoricaptor ignavus]|nr:T9SS type B sorting domain-containing protein [Cruoricaptor ignavus]